MLCGSSRGNKKETLSCVNYFSPIGTFKRVLGIFSFKNPYKYRNRSRFRKAFSSLYDRKATIPSSSLDPECDSATQDRC